MDNQVQIPLTVDFYPPDASRPSGFPESSDQAVVQQPHPGPMLVHQAFYYKYPVQSVCFYCKLHIMTKTTTSKGAYSYLMCCLLWETSACCCCLWPLCLGRCKNVKHTCPNCRALLGVWKPL